MVTGSYSDGDGISSTRNNDNHAAAVVPLWNRTFDIMVPPPPQNIKMAVPPHLMRIEEVNLNSTALYWREVLFDNSDDEHQPHPSIPRPQRRPQQRTHCNYSFVIQPATHFKVIGGQSESQQQQQMVVLDQSETATIAHVIAWDNDFYLSLTLQYTFDLRPGINDCAAWYGGWW